MRAPTLFSYVVDHDLGFAPNPEDGFCTLVHCKFRDGKKRRNIVELASIGDWVLGTGGQSNDSAGNGKLIYLMHVDENPPFQDFLSDSRFKGRRDCIDRGRGNEYALISQQFYYFGKNALDISALPNDLTIELTKSGPGFRSDYPPQKLEKLVDWFERQYETGVHGDPCSSRVSSLKPRHRQFSRQLCDPCSTVKPSFTSRITRK